MNSKLFERGTIVGAVRLIECDALKYPRYEDVDRAVRNGEADISPWIKNVIPDVGKAAIARRLVNEGSVSNEGIITYGAVGTGSAPVAAADTTLTTELFRKQLARRARTNAVITLRMFMTTGEGNGTLTEYGLFGEDASASADSGTLFERVSIDKTKTSSKTLTIESQIYIL